MVRPFLIRAHGIQDGEKVIQKNDAPKTQCSHAREKNWNIILCHTQKRTKAYSRLLRILETKMSTEDKKHHNFGPGNDALDMASKAQIIKVKEGN